MIDLPAPPEMPVTLEKGDSSVEQMTPLPGPWPGAINTELFSGLVENVRTCSQGLGYRFKSIGDEADKEFERSMEAFRNSINLNSYSPVARGPMLEGAEKTATAAAKKKLDDQLVEWKEFIERNEKALNENKAQIEGICAVVNNSAGLLDLM